MTRHAVRLTLCLCVVATVVSGCKQDSASKTTIAVIPKGTSHEFWKSVEQGAQKAGKDLNVRIIWKGPLKEDDKTQQIAIVEQFVSEGVSGICLAPLDDTALLAPVQTALQKKIPVVIFDSALKGKVGADFASYVATDNRKGGQMGGEELARLLNGKGKVVLLRYKEGHASTSEREEGFLDAIRKHAGIEIIQENRYGGATAGEAQRAAENLVDKLREADGIFCPNESSTAGMLTALEGFGLAGQKKFVGFDTSAPLVQGLKQDKIHALVAQDPTKMGYEAVSTMVKHLKGEKVPEYTDTGARLVTKAKLEDPEIKKLIGG